MSGNTGYVMIVGTALSERDFHPLQRDFHPTEGKEDEKEELVLPWEQEGCP